MRIHTSPAAAIKDWTTWAAVTVAASLGSLSVLLAEPWTTRCQIAALVLGLFGTLLRGPDKPHAADMDASD